MRFFTQKSASNRSRKELSVAKSCSSRQREVKQIELENLVAEPEAKQQLRDQQIRLENERELMTLQLQLQEQEEKLRIWVFDSEKKRNKRK